MVEINNLTNYRADQKFLKKISEKVLKKESKKEFALSVVLVGQKIIKQLNKKYLGKNQTTDILAFPETEFSKLRISESGEIVICPQVVKKNAKKFNSTFEKELNLVLIHGILHLFGYDHRKNKEAGKMREKEKYYLSI